MTRPALLANENVPRPVLQVLREAGVDVTSVAETTPGASDRDVLARAHRHGLWLVTFDRDYGELVFAREAKPPPAIVYVRQQPGPPAALGEALLDLLRNAEFAAGHLVVVSGRSLRRRPLPPPG